LSAESDRDALALIAHKIKGAARIAQAKQLIECCDALEQACEQAMSSHEISRRREASSLAMLDLEQALQQQLTLTGQSRMSGA
jgi:two-component system sensor histidine kinase EvgS